jgi:hypothetical protein
MSAPTKPIDIKQSLIDAVIAGLLALIVFGPIVGIVLDGYGFNLQPGRVAVLVGVVVVGRFFMSLFLQTPKGVAIAQSFESSGSGVHVLPPGYKTRLRFIIPLMILIAVIFPIFADKYVLTVVILGLIYVLLGLGLNIVVGLAGLLDLGYVAFYAIGAYGLALGYQYLGLGFWSAQPRAALAGARAWGLPGDRDPGLRRDHSSGAQQLAVVHRRTERRAGACADLLRSGIRASSERRRHPDPRIFRLRIQPGPEIHLHLHRAVPGRAGCAVRQAPPDAHAGRPRVGSPA